METGEGRKEAETRALIPFFFLFFLRPSLLLYFSRRLEACGPTVWRSVKPNPTGQFCKYGSWQRRGKDGICPELLPRRWPRPPARP